MNVKRILLTGDDGYASVGIRLLVHYLKHKYDLCIAATRDQQSGVGGHLSIREGGTWGETSVDGVPVFWASGYPADVVELVVGYYKKPFDLVISGINLGANIGGGFSSGTFAAAVRSVEVHHAPRALILSWDLPSSYWYLRHNDGDDLSSFLAYPGKIAGKVVERAIKHNFWNATILNINFPSEQSRKIRFTKPMDDLTKYYSYPIGRDKTKKTFSYRKKDLVTRTETRGNLTIDTGAILSGYISISPLNVNMLNEKVYKKLEKEEIAL